MNCVKEFIVAEKENISNHDIFFQLKCNLEEVLLLQEMTKQYVNGSTNMVVVDVLSTFYNIEKFEHLDKIDLIKNLLELGWLTHTNLYPLQMNEISQLELLNTSISLSNSFLKLFETKNIDLSLPDIKAYKDHLEYLQDQFLKIDLAQQLNTVKTNLHHTSPNIDKMKSKLTLLENRISERINVTKIDLMLENFFKKYHLEKPEQMIFLALLKEEYSANNETIRDMNALISLISNDDYEKIKHRSLLEESGKLLSNHLIDYDEVLSPFGGINRSFFIPEQILYKISHPNKKEKLKIKLDLLVAEQEMFELIEPIKSMEEIVLPTKTKETIDVILKQVDKNVVNTLKLWGIKNKKSGIDAKLIFYGHPGTGKTITALALAKMLKKQVLSFDCSKILSMYIGESEKNVRKIFDNYKEITTKIKSEPILLLNEADQFLSNRVTGNASGSEKMHNQMQNIFLEQIERFDGILIATTNLLETIDKAFSRRFDYKIEFKKPDFNQRYDLWKLSLHSKLPIKEPIDIKKLASYDLSGGQIELIIKNTAYKVATFDIPQFTTENFIEQIEKEQKNNFDNEKKVGFF